MFLKRNKSAFNTTLAVCLMIICSGSLANEPQTTNKVNPYPTAVIADYVLGCMAANGNTYEALHQCSCSIDYISERISYDDYEIIQTVMQVQMDRGQRGIFYRDSKWAKTRVEAMQKVQAESTLRCF